MTARDEAIEAIWRAIDYLPRQEAGTALDAIPADVLVRLAIESGALRRVEPEDWVKTPLYEVVES